MVDNNATLWHICSEELVKDRVRNHCHLPVKFSAAAYEVCNLKCKVAKFSPVIFLNFSGYDSNLFNKTLGNSEGDNSCIPSNEKNLNFFHEAGYRWQIC